jgi:splicing factor 3B subunit 4
MVDEKTLYDTFSAFGNLISAPKVRAPLSTGYQVQPLTKQIARDEAGISKGFGFISYDSFEASDKAIESMDKQFLMNKEINVQYAYKKDGKGERHGDQAERLLAAQARKHNVSMPTAQLPPALFAPQGPAAGGPPTPTVPSGPAGFRAPLQAPRQPNGMGMGISVHDQHQAPYHHTPVPPPPRGPPQGPPQGFQQSQLAPPPQGLPPRPPPPVGFQQAPITQGYPQPMPGMAPPGFGPPPGAPPPGFARPPMPQGFQPMGAPPSAVHDRYRHPSRQVRDR